jgi:2-polyprenyl-3-methyl-5-hydroxy-6-metoxy-1,4-benzoquinol methylase
MSLTLPPRSLVTKPDPDDPIDYYYKPLTAPLYRARLRDALELLGDGPFDALLEVGYGSGVLLPELARRAKTLTGIDVHEGREGVAQMAASLGLNVTLLDASLFELPFDDDSFDALVCLSVLEHLRELDEALGELRRVVRPGGVLVLGVPVRNAATNSFFRLVGYDPATIHPSSHRDVEAAVDRSPALRLERQLHFPRVLPVDFAAYVSFRCR